MTFPKPKLTSRATTDGRIEAVKIEFDFGKWREWKRQKEHESNEEARRKRTTPA